MKYTWVNTLYIIFSPMILIVSILIMIVLFILYPSQDELFFGHNGDYYE